MMTFFPKILPQIDKCTPNVDINYKRSVGNSAKIISKSRNLPDDFFEFDSDPKPSRSFFAFKLLSQSPIQRIQNIY